MLTMPFRPTIYESAEALLEAQRALAQGHPAELAKVQRMEYCHRNWLIREHLNSRSLIGRRDAFTQCRQSLCVPCLETRQRDMALAIANLTNVALGEQFGLMPTLVSFSGPEYAYFDVSACVTDAIRQYQRFCGRKSFRYVADGYVRGIQIVPDHLDGTIRAQTSLVVLVRRNDVLGSGQEWLDLWNSSGDQGPSRQLHFEQFAPAAKLASVAVGIFAERLATLTIDPLNLCEIQNGHVVCNAVKLKALQDGLHGRRLIAFGGLMSRVDAGLGA